jgi:hypothetical protein
MVKDWSRCGVSTGIQERAKMPTSDSYENTGIDAPQPHLIAKVWNCSQQLKCSFCPRLYLLGLGTKPLHVREHQWYMSREWLEAFIGDTETFDRST